MAYDSLLEEARSRNPFASDETLIVDVAAGLIELLELEPPIDPRILASYQGIQRVESALIPWAGCLIPDGDDTIIQVRSTDTPGRQRFTILHEIAHTFFRGYRSAPRYRCTPLSTAEGRDPVEALCDIAASELLMPSTFVRQRLTDAAFGLDAVHDLAAEYGSSLEASARRLVSLWPEPCLLLRMDVMTKPSDPHGEPKLRVSSSLANGDWPYMPRYKSVPDDHVLNLCRDDQRVECVSNLDAIAKTGAVELQARLYPFNDSEGAYHERVLALVRRAQ